MISIDSRALVIWMLATALALTGCVTNLTQDARFHVEGLAAGDTFELNEDAFYYVYSGASVRPQKQRLGFSVEQYQTVPETIQDDRVQYVRGVVLAGTQIQYTRIKGSYNFATGLQPLYYGKVMSGPFKGPCKVLIAELLFPHGDRSEGISDRYLTRISTKTQAPQ